MSQCEIDEEASQYPCCHSQSSQDIVEGDSNISAGPAAISGRRLAGVCCLSWWLATPGGKRVTVATSGF